MKKLLVRLIIFCVLPLALAATLFCIHIPEKYSYSYIRNAGCQGRSDWIYERIFEDTAQLDVVFIGTSHTMNAIDDSLIETHVNGLKVLNMAFCDFGRSFDYVIVKHLLQFKKPRILSIEVRESEAKLGHLQFAYLASGKDVLCAPMWFNRSWFGDVSRALQFRLQYVREYLTEQDHFRISSPDTGLLYGFNPAVGVADEYSLRDKTSTELRGFLNNQLDYASFYYIVEIKKLCSENEVKLIFHYLPEYGHPVSSLSKGKYCVNDEYLFAMKDTFYSNKLNWFDAGHLNSTGAEIYSKTISETLKHNHQRLPK